MNVWSTRANFLSMLDNQGLLPNKQQFPEFYKYLNKCLAGGRLEYNQLRNIVFFQHPQLCDTLDTKATLPGYEFHHIEFDLLGLRFSYVYLQTVSK